MSRKPKADPAADAEPAARKLGERRETITVDLSPTEVEEEKTLVMDLLGRRQNLEAAKKSTMADYKAKIDKVSEQITSSCRVATTERREIEIDVEEWINRNNQVVRIRRDTGEILGEPRTARADELQEALFGNGAADEFPTPVDAFGGDPS